MTPQKLNGLSKENQKETKQNDFRTYLDNPDLLMSWLQCLTDLEQVVISVIFQSEKAITIKETRNRIIDNSVMFVEHEMERKKLKEEPFWIIWTFPFPNYYPLPEEERHKITKFFPLDTFRKRIQAEKEIQNILRFPSFRRIENTLRNLIKLNLIFERTENLQDKKIKGLYSLNPIVRTALRKIKDHKIAEKSKN